MRPKRGVKHWPRTVLAWLVMSFSLGLCSQDSLANPRIVFNDVSSSLPLISTTIMPNQWLTISTTAKATADKGTLSAIAGGFRWQAPEQAGMTTIEFTESEKTTRLQIFVLTPFTNGQQQSLSGYVIGSYSPPLRNLPSYAPPLGFVDLDLIGADTPVSPHFTLGQFKCKQQPGHKPSYLLISTRLLLKLETLLTAANAKGWQAETLTIMSGFRTPYYNAKIGNRTTSSRHLYGDAADIYIDNNGDGRMDDLNGDGLINRADAKALASLAETLTNDPDWYPGGLSIYGANAAHGPFVHLDTRGHRSRW